jgi:hypothetical protein
MSDEVISNMDELIKQHISQRDAELRQYAPPPPLIIDNSTNISPASLNENIKYEIILPTPSVMTGLPHENPGLKKVSWQDESILDKLNKLTDEIDFIKQFLQKKWGENTSIDMRPSSPIVYNETNLEEEQEEEQEEDENEI